MKKKYLVLLFAFAAFSSLLSQTINVVSVTVTQSDSVVIRLKDYVGEIQWQESPDSLNWSDIPDGSKDTLLFIADTTTYFRASVTAGTCEPLISDIAKITMSSLPVNQPPSAPTAPVPDHESTNISINIVLKWSCSDPDGDALTCDIYFDETDASTLISENQTDTLYTPTTLGYNTIYYWKVVAKDGGGEETTGTTWSFTTMDDPGPGTVTDTDGNVYNTVIIGAQIWLDENLKTTKYNDGTAIPLVTANTAWTNLATPGYCWFNNDSATYAQTYGALYNWYTINTGKLCPTGWHVFTNADWSTLLTYLEGASVAGGKLKETGTTHWITPNTGATNETGFTALPGGARYDNATFDGIGYYGSWWSATGINTNYAWSYDIGWLGTLVNSGNILKQTGLSVRCIKD